MINQFSKKIDALRKSKIAFHSIDRIEFKSIYLQYPTNDDAGMSRAKDKIVFQEMSFNFPTDENILIEGSMGSGRSSLLKLLAGLVIPTRGSYFINDCDFAQMSFEEFLPYRLYIGYAFDYGGLLANRTLRDNLLIPLLYHNQMKSSEAEARVKGMLDVFKITGHENQRPASVSGAMRKATVVARSFILHPEMLILDDPFVGLDDEQGKNIVELIGVHRRQYGLRHVFYTTRYERFVKMLGGRSIVLANSKITGLEKEDVRRPA